MQLPAKTISYLSCVSAFLLTAYIAMVIMTIAYATMQTQLTATINTMHTEIAQLETSYYESVAQLDAIDPTTKGFVKPQHVTFVSAAEPTGLSFAAR